MTCIYNTYTTENFIHNALILPMINMTNKKHYSKLQRKTNFKIASCVQQWTYPERLFPLYTNIKIIARRIAKATQWETRPDFSTFGRFLELSYQQLHLEQLLLSLLASILTVQRYLMIWKHVRETLFLYKIYSCISTYVYPEFNTVILLAFISIFFFWYTVSKKLLVVANDSINFICY